MGVKTYENGLRLVTKKIEGMYSVALGIWVGAGSSDETLKNNGISHFIEHMLFKGTEKRTAFEITDSIDRIGAQINAFTSKECTCYYTKSTSEYTETSFDILSDMLFHSKFDEEEMAKERGVILEEISMTEDMPDDLCIDLLQKAYYKDHPLGKTIIGTPDNVKGFTGRDIKDYMSVQYNPKNIVIAVAGNIDEAEIEFFTQKYFASSFTLSALDTAERAVAYKPSPNFEYRFKNVEQSHIALGFPSISFASAGVEEALIISNIFGGGMSSRLFQSVREQKGLAYSVYSYISTYKNNGLLTIYAGVNPQNVDLAAKTIREEIDKFIAEGVTQEEFKRGREQLKGTFVMSQEVTSAVMNAIGKYMVLSGREFSMEDRIKAIDAVTFEGVNERIKTYFDFDSLCASYVGPERAEQNLLQTFTAK